MRKTEIICIGKLKEQYLKDGTKEYIKRLSRYTNLVITELACEKISKYPKPHEIENAIKKEGERVVARLSQLKDSGGYTVFPLAVSGVHIPSQDFAQLLNKNPRCVFVIGSSHGLDSSVVLGKKSISFSQLTFSHQLIRLILLEQLYRGYKILANESYHK